MISYGDYPGLTIEKNFRGYYAYDKNFDGPGSTWGHGMTPDEAVANYWEKRSD